MWALPQAKPTRTAGDRRRVLVDRVARIRTQHDVASEQAVGHCRSPRHCQHVMAAAAIAIDLVHHAREAMTICQHGTAELQHH
jgi:hypothetical protein